MAGYSGTPLVQKLGIKPGARLALFAAPSGFTETLGALPEGVKAVTTRGAKAGFDVAVFFTKSQAELDRALPTLKKNLDPSGGLWIAWPKKASGVKTDITEDVVRRLALPADLVDNKVCAVDDTWSGLRIVYRLQDRPAKPRAIDQKTKEAPAKRKSLSQPARARTKR